MFGREVAHIYGSSAIWLEDSLWRMRRSPLRQRCELIASRLALPLPCAPRQNVNNFTRFIRKSETGNQSKLIYYKKFSDGCRGGCHSGTMRNSKLIVLACVWFLVMPLVFAAMVFMFFGFFFHGWWSSSNSSHGSEAHGSGVQLAVFIVLSALPLLIYLMRRGFSKRRKSRNRSL